MIFVTYYLPYQQLTSGHTSTDSKTLHLIIYLSIALSSDSATEHLRRWGLDSVEGLKKAIIETSYNLKKAVNRGHSEIVEEETEKLAAMQQLLCDVSASPLHSPPTICSISSQNDIVEDEESTRLPNVRS